MKTMKLFGNSVVFDYMYYVVDPSGAKVTETYCFEQQAIEKKDWLCKKDGVEYRVEKEKAA